MARVRVLHWNAAEASPLLEKIAGAGHTVEYQPTYETALMREWRKSPPHAFVIDLSRLPSHGREIAVALRASPATRRVPIVFCGGEPAKAFAIRTQLPDASFCELRSLRSKLKAALANPPSEPVVPAQMMDRYGSRSTAQKLGILPRSSVLVVNPPPHYRSVLGDLPAEVEFLEEDGEAPVTLCFATSADILRNSLSRLRGRARATRLWVLWPKKKANANGPGENLVRETGIELGLVDYKVCSVDLVWSGLLFAAR